MYTLSFLPNNKFLARSESKAFADMKVNVTENLKIVLERVENAEKDKNAGYQHFLLFKQYFQTTTFKAFPKQALVFTCLQYKSFENTVGKGEIPCKEQFLLLRQYFIPV